MKTHLGKIFASQVVRHRVGARGYEEFVPVSWLRSILGSECPPPTHGWLIARQKAEEALKRGPVPYIAMSKPVPKQGSSS